MSDEQGSYWDGETFLYQATITNGAGGAGNHSYTFTIPAGSEAELLYGEIFNGDTSNRTTVIDIQDGSGNRIATIINATLNASERSSFPLSQIFSSAGNAFGGPGRVILSGGMIITFSVLAVTLSENSALGVVFRIRGNVPTVVETGASTPTIAINVEETR